MRPITVLTIFFTIALTLTACGPAAPAVDTPAPIVAESDSTPAPSIDAYLSTDYSDAASLRNQLAFGTLRLDGTPQAVSPEQAAILLPLWQAMKSLSGTSTTMEVELTSVQNQIIETMTPEQLSAIAEMKITNNKLSVFYAEFGIAMPTPVPGVTKVPGSGSGVSQADKEATRSAAQALGTPVGSGAGQAAKTLLYDKVIELLTLRVAE